MKSEQKAEDGAGFSGFQKFCLEHASFVQIF